MIEKVNPAHPDKIADRIAGAIADLAYSLQKDPKIAVEVLIGHGKCYIIIESSIRMKEQAIVGIVKRIAGPMQGIKVVQVPQDYHLAENQVCEVRCGDNGIFKSAPLTAEQKKLSKIARDIYEKYHSDGKYILDKDKLIICQSNAPINELMEMYPNAIINPLGDWTGGINVDTGCTNRKTGSDLYTTTGGGLCGKDCSKSDVSIMIYAFLKAQTTGKKVEISCAIGDTEVDGRPYSEVVELAKKYIKEIGGFEKLAEWGLT